MTEGVVLRIVNANEMLPDTVRALGRKLGKVEGTAVSTEKFTVNERRYDIRYL